MNESPPPFIQICIPGVLCSLTFTVSPLIQSPPPQSLGPSPPLALDSVCGYLCLPNSYFHNYLAGYLVSLSPPHSLTTEPDSQPFLNQVVRALPGKSPSLVPQLPWSPAQSHPPRRNSKEVGWCCACTHRVPCRLRLPESI